MTTLVATVFVSSASADSEQDPSPALPTEESAPSPVATAESNESKEDIEDTSVDILSIEKSKGSRFTALTARITNNGLDNLPMSAFDNDVYDYREAQPSGIKLDVAGQTRHHPIMDAEKYCLCSGYASRTPFVPIIQPNESVDYWMLYNLPADTQQVTVEIPGFDPIEDVPVE
ncbi:DUF5067 domain-containing protein [Streptomonospora salina]|uniref:DUF4352 domain-containing protein n=1 Tax=Streptomonospora salina TaxID=104205 RepID=A0A841E7N0_9ACTN|nr:DUF5067 domain-containing protein [Streptomonospora salina]MBB5997309.1 hypothetical protein [Streptomonospora salina]